MAMGKYASLPYPIAPTQGRLHCTQHTILCTALQVDPIPYATGRWQSQLRSGRRKV